MMLWCGWPHLGGARVKRRLGVKRPDSLFNVQGGEIVVDEKFLAAKPGPSRSASPCSRDVCRLRERCHRDPHRLLSVPDRSSGLPPPSHVTSNVPTAVCLSDISIGDACDISIGGCFYRGLQPVTG
jgi:hypothetical protein